MPTVKEYDKYGHGKPPPATKTTKKHTPNLVVYSDVSGDGDVPNVHNVGVDDNTVPYDDPVLSRVRLKSYLSAAAGSATQPGTDVVVLRGVEAGSSSSSPPPLKCPLRLAVHKDCRM